MIMIISRTQLREYLNQDALACKRVGIRPKLIGDEIWKFQYSMRQLDYQLNRSDKSFFTKPVLAYWKVKNHRLAVKLGFSISHMAVIGKGFSIAHYGPIVINSAAVIGDNCRIHEGVCIGATNGSGKAPRIGNNVFIATGAKIIGDLTIADDVAIGANAVVIRDIGSPGTTWGGIPARQVSDSNSHSNLSPLLRLDG